MADANLADCGVYVIRNSANGKAYVGSSIKIAARWRAHKADLAGDRHHSIALQRAWNRRGPNGFEFAILEHVVDRRYLTAREQHWIAELKAFGRGGYNMCPTAGSCCGRRFSEATKAKMSKSANQRQISEYGRQRLSASVRARPKDVWQRSAAKRRGMKHSAETRAKMSAAQKGRKCSEETRAKLAAIFHSMPDERRARMLAARKLVPTPPMSAEARAKSSATKMGHAVSAETRAKIAATLRARKLQELTDGPKPISRHSGITTSIGGAVFVVSSEVDGKS